ncbi:MAG: LysR family transcriptional regulator [Pseudomonadota bacterium]
MSSQTDRLTLLATFVRIVERGSISAAARDLGLSQATVSRQLKDLEDRFRSEFVRRTTHSLALTPSGEALLADARRLLGEWEVLAERHASGQDRVAGLLKIVAPVGIGQSWLAEIMLRFQRTHPDVAITWDLDDAPIRFAEIGCDCWIKVGPIQDDSLIVRPLARVERMVAASPRLLAGQSASSPGDLSHMPCVALSPFEGGKIALSDHTGRQETITPPVALATNNIVALRQAVRLGIGFAVLPRWFIEDDLTHGGLIDALPGWRATTLTIHAGYLPSRHQPLRLRLFLDHLIKDITDVPGLLDVA